MASCVFESCPNHVPGMVLPRFDYTAPERLDHALELLAGALPDVQLLAGGTDLLVKMKRGLLRPRLLISLRRVRALHGIHVAGIAGGGLRIGALVTMNRLAAQGTLSDPFAALAEGAASVGGPLIRNRATVGGNVINARPCADTVPPLVALGAQLRLRSPAGERLEELDGFIRGAGDTALRPGEILISLELPAPPPDCTTGSCYLKLTRRAAMEVTIAGCAASITLDSHKKVRRARLVFTSVAPTPLRIVEAEPILEGSLLTESSLVAAAAAARKAVRPIDDHRAPASYRTEMVEVLARRGLRLARERAERSMP